MNYAMTLAAGLVPAATPAAPAARKRLDAYRGKPQPSASSPWWPWASSTCWPTGGRVRSTEANSHIVRHARTRVWGVFDSIKRARANTGETPGARSVTVLETGGKQGVARCWVRQLGVSDPASPQLAPSWPVSSAVERPRAPHDLLIPRPREDSQQHQPDCIHRLGRSRRPGPGPR